MTAKKFVMKVVVAGAGGVGKTTLLTRAVTGKFVQQTSMTIGVEFHLLNLTINGVAVTLQLSGFWRTRTLSIHA